MHLRLWKLCAGSVHPFCCSTKKLSFIYCAIIHAASCESVWIQWKSCLVKIVKTFPVFASLIFVDFESSTITLQKPNRSLTVFNYLFSLPNLGFNLDVLSVLKGIPFCFSCFCFLSFCVSPSWVGVKIIGLTIHVLFASQMFVSRLSNLAKHENT